LNPLKANDISALSVTLLVFLVACAPARKATVVDQESSGGHETLNAAVWMQLSAEYAGSALQAYRIAKTQLGEALKDSSWSALPDQHGAESFPPAVIVDVDETVLDNSPFQARLVRANQTYVRDAWNKWVREERARPIPGALDFVRAASEAGVRVFYVTNRSSDLEEATRNNLLAVGFPVAEDVDVVLTRAELAAWTGDKSSRRDFVAKDHRVLLLIGDDLNDFVVADGVSSEGRSTLVSQNAEYWGSRWIVLPNPVYGSWERTVNQEGAARSRAEQVRAKSEALRTQ
jgi:acid phosphatase